eukprot:GHVL01043696.1.p1 GENE.GHVL01043696.1~~GHVL01043696.1.p1  ORF type:complete len:593 (+),score=99.93 GHVL01043696.1:39-1781(+)
MKWPATHSLVKWPVLIVFAMVILMEFLMYWVVRLVVKLLEKLLYVNSSKEKRIYQKMMMSTTAAEYQHYAQELDKSTGKEKWKSIKTSRYLVSDLIERRLNELKRARMKDDMDTMIRILASVVHTKFAGIMKEDLYTRTFSGTKLLIEEYIDELCICIRLVTDKANEGCAIGSPLGGQIKQLLRCLEGTWGCSALCLSGGGALGLFHLGCIEVLFKENLLPEVICGTSAGAVVAAIICTKNDEEMSEEFTQNGLIRYFDCFHGSLYERFIYFYKNGCLFDETIWQNKLSKLFGDCTFEEAYEHSGRKLNIVVSRKRKYGPPVVLNYQNSPSVLIRSAILASSAFPGLIGPQRLLAKQCGEIVMAESYSSEFFHDGCIDADIPIIGLSEAWGCQFHIVSQVNPHIAPFFFRERGDVGKPLAWRRGGGRWRGGFILSALEMSLREHMKLLLKLLAALDVLPRFRGVDWEGMYQQEFGGDVSLTPRRMYVWAIRHSLSDPTPSILNRFWHEGQLMTFPKLSMIRNRMRIETEIMRLRESFRESASPWMGGLSPFSARSSSRTSDATKMNFSSPPLNFIDTSDS